MLKNRSLFRVRPHRAIYMDGHATTPVDPRVLNAMLPFFVHRFGNAASFTHSFGREADEKVQAARQEVARLIGADAREIVFTSGATESNNLAIKGAALANRKKGNHLLTVGTEHKSVLDSCKRLELLGFKVTTLPVQKNGRLDLDDLKKALSKKTILISVMLANNETGVIQPVAQIGEMARKRGILFHCDAAQGAGVLEINVKAMNVDLLSLSAHKIYGPKGVGALYVRRGVSETQIIPQIDGGGHETGFRSGTLNVPGIVGLGKACRLSMIHRKADAARLGRLRDKLKSGLLKDIEGCLVNGCQDNRLPNNLNVSFEGVEAKSLIPALKGVAVSSGSACTATSLEPSYVLKAMGVSEELRHASIRFGLGRFTTEKEVNIVIEKVIRAVKRLRMTHPDAKQSS